MARVRHVGSRMKGLEVGMFSQSLKPLNPKRRNPKSLALNPGSPEIQKFSQTEAGSRSASEVLWGM